MRPALLLFALGLLAGGGGLAQDAPEEEAAVFTEYEIGPEDILRIDAASGRVEAVVDADGLLEPDPADADPDAVLNGIAHLGDDRFLITGKRWPAVFEVRFVPDVG